MKKEKIRREFFKLRLSRNSYSQCKKILKEKYDYEVTTRTLKGWRKKVEFNNWDLRDKSTKPKTIHYKFSKREKEEIIILRKKTGYSSHQIRIKLEEKGIIMSESFIKQVVKEEGLSRGNKMEGTRLKWVRFERDNPNSMWQLDGTETEDGEWILPVEDDCSRYCVIAKKFKHMTTANVIAVLEEAIAMHGKPREILTDNGPEFGGKSKDSEFDQWCERQGIIHIRSGVHKPTTVGKVSAIQQTIKRELPYCNNDLDAWRYRYNHERPHQSLHGLTPARVYFQFRRHKKHYEL